jgi:hypothetical protein
MGPSFANGPSDGKPREVAASETTFWHFAHGTNPGVYAS